MSNTPAWQFFNSSRAIDFSAPADAGLVVVQVPPCAQINDGLAQGRGICVDSKGRPGMCLPCEATAPVGSKVAGWPVGCDLSMFGRGNLPGFNHTTHLGA